MRTPPENRSRPPVPSSLRRRVRPLLAVGVTVLALVLPGSAPAGAGPSDTGLKKAIDTILADSRMTGATASVVVADAVTGERLYQRNADDRLVPASNTKIVTSIAAMGLLGPEYRFTTDVLATGRRAGSTLRGDLHLRGGGDPTTLARDYDRLAAAVAAAGITRVSGGLIADDTRFDRERLGRNWSADDESAYYSAQISPLTVAPDTDYDSGTVIVEAAPGARAGDRPVVTVTPRTRYVRIDNRGTTVERGGADTLSIARGHGGNTVTVSGSMPVGGGSTKEWTTVWEPTGYAAAVFSDALARHGVRVGGATVLGRATPAGARTLASHRSMPLRELLMPLMKLSNNMHAETLTKAIGYAKAGSGTWGAGLTAIRGQLRSLGVDTGTLRLTDGSGLSRMNLIPAAQLTRLLLAVREAPWYPRWVASLPVACAPERPVGGGLRSRMCGTPAALNARAKIGSLTGVSSLAGYVKDAAGRELAFAVVLNNYVAPSVKGVEDAIVVTLARSRTAGTAGTGIAPVAPRPPQGAGAAADSGEVRAELECVWRKPDTC
ncbi:D-alanyl-D-alanine carboxypeptidase/D-alanyl-D-alanine-endopeptidase [Streptomyces clavuligerus]|uniref:Putative penicillin-binding exported protein n=2 Tax=Streptomyces clavuligerus TaxID=1901 RepID=E2Q8G8_STRCL|nr:D-alanyl-D-alanine carboxypeptidase/D-alanyl-D-alanine-endopeptidase [Streptomyces clavuligerus]ANW19703.1 D-alanyl-D-alanine carboxypeptidase/D-alanyl-D-alanine-endopeptidase [Streptomyces clavuligerus]AXU14316.1 D-alanyl-D-alanine carboxypeptidase/D-alanyl-D-alanine-endopeptidase [Streptomyces clavuligerus]EFG07456.1 putative penicillin-binding exported protein [Streptomyces clavuligerus]MBY6304320.1 D-alanyl-D-alanine carboxypeptidase/D-alanyl-D-alanine-endopeptidase [Streptomyces clavuli